LCFYYSKSRAAYYERVKTGEREQIREELILDMILEERRLQPRLGGRKLYHILRKDLHLIAPHFGRDKFFDLLRNNGLLVSRKRSYVKTTNSYHRFHKYKNLIKDKELTLPNQVYVSDITYLRTLLGFVYLSLLTDKFSRKIVGWSLSSSLGIESSILALEMALKDCPDTTKLIHHSDRGIQYCSIPYTDKLQKNGVQISMTEDNHCYENGLAERVNGILKDEYGLDGTFIDINQAEKAVREAVLLYNTRRPHYALNLQTPEDVHKKVA
jgi:transposase InsO family protein